MQKVAFELFGLHLLEPLSTLMNGVLATQAFVFYKRLTATHTVFQKYWKWFFLAYGFSFIFGGCSHLFYNYLGQYGKIPGWSCAVVGVFIAELAMLLDMQEIKKKQMLTAVVRAKLFATFAMLAMDLTFKWVMIHTTGFFVMVVMLSYHRQKQGQVNYRFLLYSMTSLLAIGIAKVGELDIHPAWFNRDDVAHVIMLVMYWLVFKGVMAYQAPQPQRLAEDHS